MSAADRRPGGLCAFGATALCAWAALHHTPPGALARDGWARLTGSRAGTRPLLAYYGGGIYEAGRSVGSSASGLLASGAGARDPGEAAGLGAHAVWTSLPESRRGPAREVAARLGIAPSALADPATGADAFARVLAEAGRALGSDDAAAVALFCGWEPARYAAERARAAGGAPGLEALVQALPPGYSAGLAAASRALMLGTAHALRWPLAQRAPVTSPFGWREHPVTGKRQRHTGVDLAVPVGTAVLAAGAGRVRRASEDAVNGRLVVVDHGHGVTTAYCHNDALLAAGGDAVGAGQMITRSGNTGRSTGPHLHYQVELAREPVDPLGLGSARAGGVAGAQAGRGLE